MTKYGSGDPNLFTSMHYGHLGRQNRGPEIQIQIQKLLKTTSALRYIQTWWCSSQGCYTTLNRRQEKIEQLARGRVSND